MQQLITTPNKIKCINLDWLSVYCLEPKGVVMNAAYFKALGWTVEEREYGTPQYREKFTLMNGKHPFLEIERNPYSLNRMEESSSPNHAILDWPTEPFINHSQCSN